MKRKYKMEFANKIFFFYFFLIDDYFLPFSRKDAKKKTKKIF